MDLPHRDAGLREIDDELRQACMAIFTGFTGAHQRNEVVHAMRVRCPDFAAVDHPAAVASFRACAYRREVRTGIGLAHADAEEALACADARDDGALRLLA